MKECIFTLEPVTINHPGRGGGGGRVGGFSDSIHCRRFMPSPRIPYNFLVWVYSYTILLSYFKRLIHKDFPPS